MSSPDTARIASASPQFVERADPTALDDWLSYLSRDRSPDGRRPGAARGRAPSTARRYGNDRVSARRQRAGERSPPSRWRPVRVRTDGRGAPCDPRTRGGRPRHRRPDVRSRRAPGHRRRHHGAPELACRPRGVRLGDRGRAAGGRVRTRLDAPSGRIPAGVGRGHSVEGCRPGHQRPASSRGGVPRRPGNPLCRAGRSRARTVRRRAVGPGTCGVPARVACPGSPRPHRAPWDACSGRGLRHAPAGRIRELKSPTAPRPIGRRGRSRSRPR